MPDPIPAEPPLPPSRPRRRSPAVLLLGAAAVLLSACQVSVATDVTVSPDGSGRIALLVALDEELASSLAADDVDPFAGLDELPGGWTSERADRDGGRAVTVSAAFDSPSMLTRRVDQLRAGLDAADPVLVDRLDVAVAEDGSASFTGRAGFTPPSSTGLRGGGVSFDGEDLRALLADRGDEVLRVDLRVAMPGAIVDSNADQVDGNVATWRLPTTEMAEVRATSEPPSTLRRWLLVGAVGLLGLAVGLVAVRLLSRRRPRGGVSPPG